MAMYRERKKKVPRGMGSTTRDLWILGVKSFLNISLFLGKYHQISVYRVCWYLVVLIPKKW